VPDYLLIDAMQLDVLIEQKSLIKGDARSVSIAAASILAKTHRDARMDDVRRDLRRIRFGATQRLRDAGTSGSVTAAGPYAAASLFVRPGPSGGVLVHWRDADSAAYFLGLKRGRHKACASPWSPICHGDNCLAHKPVLVR